MKRGETGWAILSFCVATATGLLAASGQVLSGDMARLGLVLTGIAAAAGVFMIGTGGRSEAGSAAVAQAPRKPLVNIDPEVVTLLLVIGGIPVVMLVFMIIIRLLLKVATAI